MKEVFIRHGASRVTEDDIKKVADRADDIKRKFATAGPLGRFVQDGRLLLALVRDYYRGAYRKVPYWAITAVVFALLYILNPLDILPDILPLLGYVDDAAVMGLCLGMIEHQLHEYRVWKESVEER